MSRDDPNPLAIERSFKEKLKGKSRRRREDLARLAAPAAAPRPLRNDVLPLLEITYVPLGERPRDHSDRSRDGRRSVDDVSASD
jgi:hypothetical protein